MNSLSKKRRLHLHLPRLDPRWYQGFAFVHWTMAIRDRVTGWLDGPFHHRFRELLLHSMMMPARRGGTATAGVACPIYCLMPDHLHLLLIGWDEAADQRKLVAFLRRQVNAELAARSEREIPVRLQKQAYDHVLKEEERERNAVERTVYYIAENPVRAGIAENAEDYQFTGCVVPGYPELDRNGRFWRDDGNGQTEYWMRFWRIYGAKL